MRRIGISELPLAVDGEAWVFGKGPSFERVDWSKVGHPRIAVNETAVAVAGCDAMVATDVWPRWFHNTGLYPFAAVSPDWANEPFDGSGPSEIVAPAWWDRWCVFRPMGPPFEKLAGMSREQFRARDWLCKSLGTVTAAVHLGWVLGAEVVHGWGLDGGHQYGRRWWTMEHTKETAPYDRFLAVVDELAEVFNFTFENDGKDNQ